MEGAGAGPRTAMDDVTTEEALADGQRGVQRKQAKPFPAGAPEPLADALQTTREARSFVELLNRIERLHSPTAWEARQGSPATGESQHSASEPYQPERYSAGSAETSPGAATAEKIADIQARFKDLLDGTVAPRVAPARSRVEKTAGSVQAHSPASSSGSTGGVAGRPARPDGSRRAWDSGTAWDEASSRPTRGAPSATAANASDAARLAGDKRRQARAPVASVPPQSTFTVGDAGAASEPTRVAPQPGAAPADAEGPRRHRAHEEVSRAPRAAEQATARAARPEDPSAANGARQSQDRGPNDALRRMSLPRASLSAALGNATEELHSRMLRNSLQKQAELVAEIQLRQQREDALLTRLRASRKKEAALAARLAESEEALRGAQNAAADTSKMVEVESRLAALERDYQRALADNASLTAQVAAAEGAAAQAQAAADAGRRRAEAAEARAAESRSEIRRLEAVVADTGEARRQAREALGEMAQQNARLVAAFMAKKTELQQARDALDAERRAASLRDVEAAAALAAARADCECLRRVVARYQATLRGGGAGAGAVPAAQPSREDGQGGAAGAAGRDGVKEWREEREQWRQERRALLQELDRIKDWASGAAEGPGADGELVGEDGPQGAGAEERGAYTSETYAERTGEEVEGDGKGQRRDAEMCGAPPPSGPLKEDARIGDPSAAKESAAGEGVARGAGGAESGAEGVGAAAADLRRSQSQPAPRVGEGLDRDPPPYKTEGGDGERAPRPAEPASTPGGDTGAARAGDGGAGGARDAGARKSSETTERSDGQAKYPDVSQGSSWRSDLSPLRRRQWAGEGFAARGASGQWTGGWEAGEAGEEVDSGSQTRPSSRSDSGGSASDRYRVPTSGRASKAHAGSASPSNNTDTAGSAGSGREHGVSAEGLKESGNRLFREGRYKEAVQSYTRALEAASSDSMRAVLRGNRAAASLALGQYPDTMVDCLVAAKLDPTYARVHQRLAEAHAAVGDFASAHASLCDLNRRAPSLMTPDLTAKLYAWQRKGQSQGELELYAVLGVPETASDKDVRAAYRRMALRLHPDKAPCEATRAAHDQVFKLVARAHSTLSDETQRRQYDAARARRRLQRAFTTGAHGFAAMPVNFNVGMGTRYSYGRF